MKPLIHAYCSLCGDRYQYAAVSGFFYCPFDFRTPHVSKHPSRGGAEGKRTRYVERLGGSSQIIRATGRIFKSRGAALAGMKMPTRAVRTFPSYFFNGVGGSLGENPHRY
jgi:hypothetical protein